MESGHVLEADFINDEDFSALEYCIPMQLLAYLTYTAKGIDLNVRNYPRTRDALQTKAKPVQRSERGKVQANGRKDKGGHF